MSPNFQSPALVTYEDVRVLRRRGRHHRFLPSYPYHDHIPLNVLAGQLALFLAQSCVQESSSESGSDSDEDSEEGDSDSTSPERISTAPGEGGGEEGTGRKKNLDAVKGE